MKIRLVCSILLLTCLAAPASAFDQPSEREMMVMLKKSGAVEILIPVMDQLVKVIGADIRKKQPDLPDRAYTVINDELTAGARQMIKEMLSKQMEYYASRLSKQDVQELIAIYSSPAWEKYKTLNKDYIRDVYPQVLRTDVPRMTQDMLKRVFNRLREEGLLNKTEGQS